MLSNAFRYLPLIALFAVWAGGPAAACTGDCDANGAVAVNEAVRGVAIALGQSSLETCRAFDRNGNDAVTIDELLMAVNAVLLGCPATPGPSGTATIEPTPTTSPPASATVTDSPTMRPTATPIPTTTTTPTATANQPPAVATASIYRTFEGEEIRIPLAIDPEGGPLECLAETLPAGAILDGGELRWTPTDAQLGPHYLPFSCSDAAQASADGELTFKVLPLDPCSIPTCTPEAGCTVAVPDPDQLCCTGDAIPRVAEPIADCPAGRAVFIGRNVNGFGRLQNCDVMQVRVFAQSGAQFSVRVESRCLDTNNRIEVAVRVETRTRGVMVDAVSQQFFFTAANGFARPTFPLTFTVLGGGPFFDIEEDGEANIHVRLTDVRGVSAETALRVRLRFARPADLPEAES